MIKKEKNFWVITLLSGTLIVLIGVLNHYLFRTFAFDYAAYNFAWRDYAHFRISPCPVYWIDRYSFFQDHFSFTLMILSPLYWILTPVFGQYSLILIQAFFILFGGWGTYKLVKLKTEKEWMAVLALILYYTMYGRWAAFITDVNLEIILASIVPPFLYFFEKKNFIWSSILFAFLILGRENIPLWMIFIGLYLVVEHWNNNKKKRNLAIVYILISGLYFVLVFKWFIPATHPADRPFVLFNYGALGDGPVAAIKTILTNPEKAFFLLFINHSGDNVYDFVKMEFYFVYLLSGMILLLWKPKYLLLFIPIIAQKMYNDDPIRWSIESYYSIEVVSMLPFAVFLALNELKINNEKIKKGIGIAFIILSVGLTIYKFDLVHRQLPWYPEDKNKFFSKKMYSAGFDVKKVYSALQMIPDTEKVAAGTFLAPHLAFRDYIYYLPRIDDANYIAVLLNKHHHMLKNNYDKFINDYVFSRKWRILVRNYPILILKRNNKNKILDSIYCDCESLTKDSLNFTDKESLFLFSGGHQISHTTFHSQKSSVKLDKLQPFALSTIIDSVKAGKSIRISIWRKGKGVILVASSIATKSFYKTSEKIINKEGDWEKIQLDCIIRKKLPDNKLKIYVWKNGNDQDSAFVDDMVIKYK